MSRTVATLALLACLAPARWAFAEAPPLHFAAAQSMDCRHIRLDLEVYIGRKNSRLAGDLDNYVTGVCDGLMAAHPRAKLHETWAVESSPDIRPQHSIAILDDFSIMEISAKKLTGSREEPWYRITLSGD